MTRGKAEESASVIDSVLHRSGNISSDREGSRKNGKEGRNAKDVQYAK